MSVFVFAFGLNHFSAPISIRERVSVPPSSLKPFIDAIQTTFKNKLHEVAVISTCNRTELYCSVESELIEYLPSWFAEYNHLNEDALHPYIYKYYQGDVARHAFRVASGLDSAILGEPQILGQMKKAVRIAGESGSLGSFLHQLFQQTFSVAKEVRSQTSIGSGTMSIAATIVRLSQRIFGDLNNAQILFIGAGEIVELCATYFSRKYPKTLFIANRTLRRSKFLASRISAEFIEMSSLMDRLPEFDIVISCTSSPLPILRLDMVEKTIRERRSRPMMMIDLAIPRDIEPGISNINGMYLYSIDDLSKLANANNKARKSEIARAECIIEARVQEFVQWLQSRDVVPVILNLLNSVDNIRILELEKAKRSLKRGDLPDMVLEVLSRNLTRKYLHNPLALLNNCKKNEEREQLISWISRLFLENTIRR